MDSYSQGSERDSRSDLSSQHVGTFTSVKDTALEMWIIPTTIVVRGPCSTVCAASLMITLAVTGPAWVLVHQKWNLHPYPCEKRSRRSSQVIPGGIRWELLVPGRWFPSLSITHIINENVDNQIHTWDRVLKKTNSSLSYSRNSSHFI